MYGTRNTLGILMYSKEYIFPSLFGAWQCAVACLSIQNVCKPAGCHMMPTPKKWKGNIPTSNCQNTCLSCYEVTFDFRAGVYLYALPHFYLLPAINIQLSSGNLLSLLVLCATLWSYFCLEISCAVSYILLMLGFFMHVNNPVVNIFIILR